jgi:hypothetical protein
MDALPPLRVSSWESELKVCFTFFSLDGKRLFVAFDRLAYNAAGGLGFVLVGLGFMRCVVTRWRWRGVRSGDA